MLIVEKYGGSSVATTKQIKDIAKHIKEEVDKGNKMVVVVSAMGKTTNNLIALSQEITSTPNKREMDQLLSTGELQSVALLSIALNDISVKAISLSGKQAGIVTNENFSHAFIKQINIKEVQKYLNKNKVVIIAGFQGVTKNGDTTTLGRGGSDTTAVAIASALGCSCNIYTDVFAICTTDPKLYPTAKKQTQITFDEMMELAVGGAKVLETRSVELAKIYNVDLYLGKSLETDKTKGTYIMNKKNFEDVVVTGVAIKENMTSVTLKTTKSETINSVVEFLKNKNIEFLSISKDKENTILSFVIPQTNLKEFEEKYDSSLFEIKPNLSKITVVGTGLATHSQLIVDMFYELSKNNISVFNMSVSEISVAFTVEDTITNKTVNVLARLFNL